MIFRLRAFALHLLASATVLTLVLGSLYLGWYRWPGWYLADAGSVAFVLVAVDVTVGPLLTLVIAHPKKPRRELARDITIIASLQLCALLYGAVSLWVGRPLYYAFSENVLQLVQASDIGGHEIALAERQHAPILPHWYSRPRWIWAPLPADPKESQKIISSVFNGGDDVISMPRYYQPWANGLPALRKQLKRVLEVAYFSPRQKQQLAQAMRAQGLNADEANAIVLTGRGPPLLAVIDPRSLKIEHFLRPQQQSVGSIAPASVQRLLRSWAKHARVVHQNKPHDHSTQARG